MVARAERRTKRIAFGAIKIAISVGLLIWLIRQAVVDKSFIQLRDDPKHWPLLAAAFACVMASVTVTIIRWWLLVRALDLPFTMASAFRLGFLGYLLNFVSLGSVGGDLFKAVFIAREQPNRRTEAVATVVVDRVVGLYALFLVAATALFLSDVDSIRTVAQLRTIATAAYFCTAVGAVFIVLLLITGFASGPISKWLVGLPGAGPVIANIFLAVRMYRQRYLVLIVALIMSFAVHSLLAIAIWLISRGIPGESPTLAEEFIIVPLSMFVGALPLPAAGLGAFEAALDFLYRRVATGPPADRVSGFVVALCYRVITVLVAAVGVIYYLTSRREVKEAMLNVEKEMP